MEKWYALFLESTGVCTDTRAITKDSMFIALKGANFNGNAFAEEALRLGAKYAIVDEEQYANRANVFCVADTLVFLQELALDHRRKFSIPVIGITGSNGKTTTKELIAAVLQEKYNILYTKGNLNNHIGVPLTVLQMAKEHELAIIEMGANKFKDIAELSAIAEPTHGIITNIGKAHLEGFGDFNGVLRTKKELYDAVESKSGHLIYNADDSTLTNILPTSTRNLAYAQDNDHVLVRGKLDNLTPFVQLHWSTDGYTSPVLSMQMVGEYNFYNYLAAITFGVFFEVPKERINYALEHYIPNNNRSQVQKTAENTLIVDCYNANPTSMSSALSSFARIDQVDKLAILGDMRELGEEEANEHQKVIAYLTENRLEALLVGPVFHKMDSKFRSFASVEELNMYLNHHTPKKHLILLKGSRGIRLEHAIANL